LLEMAGLGVATEAKELELAQLSVIPSPLAVQLDTPDAFECVSY